MEEKKNNALEKAENATNSARQNQMNQEVFLQDEVQADELNFQAEKQVEMEKERAVQYRNKEKGGRKKGNSLIKAVIALGILSVALATALIVTFLIPSQMDLSLEQTYQKSFYDAVEQVDNMDLNLSKILATKDEGAMQKYLVDLAINSEVCENDIQQLPLHDENKYYTTKLINQIGDYAKYVNKKIIDKKEVTEKDREGLKRLYTANKDLKRSLENTVEKMGADFSFATVMEGGAGNLIISNFNELQNLSVEYPELIYDGPFSDGQNQKGAKGLSSKEITAQEALELFKQTFARRGVTDFEIVGQTTGDIECYNLQGKVKEDMIFAQYTKKGGKMIMFSFAGSCNSVQCEQEDAVETGLEFLRTQGIESVKPVWTNLAGNVYTINFAHYQKGVVVYPDLIKIRVCAETNTVIGLEAKSYYTNHTERQISTPTLTSESAKEKVFEKMQINATRLALVPVGESEEKLCYEFYGKYEDSDYYVYIDAENGRQVEMFKVVKGTEGDFLL